MNLRQVLLVAIITALYSAALCTAESSAQSQSSANAFHYYSRTVKQVTELDWNLLQFNLLWHDSYGSGEYVKSSPVWFDYQTMTFKAHLRVANKRDYRDSQPFLSLPAARQRAILQEVVDYLVELLGKHFPKVNAMQDHLDVTFIYRETGGGSSNVATYRNGQLQLLTR